MSNQTIILYSKEKDRELLQELREALVKKGFGMYVGFGGTDINEHDNTLVVWWDNKLAYYPKHCIVAIDCTIIPVSRNDFQTLFLLY
jgi:hypothetical protein